MTVSIALKWITHYFTLELNRTYMNETFYVLDDNPDLKVFNVMLLSSAGYKTHIAIFRPIKSDSPSSRHFRKLFAGTFLEKKKR
jgi:hypothetical protein